MANKTRLLPASLLAVVADQNNSAGQSRLVHERGSMVSGLIGSMSLPLRVAPYWASLPSKGKHKQSLEFNYLHRLIR